MEKKKGKKQTEEDKNEEDEYLFLMPGAWEG
jgi:hypothetical protein